MSLILADRVKETSSTTGTGNFTLAGASTGFRTFNSAIGVGPRTFYAIVSDDGSQWELGMGYLSAATTLLRTTVFRNSLGTTAKIDFSAGSKSVFVTLPSNNVGTGNALAGESSLALGGTVNGSPEVYFSWTALGVGTTINGSSTTAVGSSANAGALQATAVGSAAVASTRSTAVGRSASANSTESVAIGNQSSASASTSVSIGYVSSSSGAQSVAVGYGATTSASGALALGNRTANQVNQFCAPVRFDPSGVDAVYSLKYDQYSSEIYASSTGGGVTQIIAGTGITISPAGGTGVVTISAAGAATSFNWFSSAKSPLPSSLTAPTNYTATPAFPSNATFAGMVNIAPFGSWNNGNSGAANIALKYQSSWNFNPSPFGFGGGTYPSGLVLCYLQYPQGHMMSSIYNIWGSYDTWNNGFGNNTGTYFNPPPGSLRKMYMVFVIQSGPTDLSGLIALSSSYPAAAKTTVYDSFSGNTVLAVQIENSAQAVSAATGGSFVANWPGSYNYYGHIWIEYS